MASKVEFNEVKKHCLSILGHIKQLISRSKVGFYEQESLELTNTLTSLLQSVISSLEMEDADGLFNYLIVPLKSLIEIYKFDANNGYLTQNHTTLACDCLSGLFLKSKIREHLIELTKMLLFPFLATNSSKNEDSKDNAKLTCDYQISLLNALYQLYLPFSDKNGNMKLDELIQDNQKPFIACIIGTILDIATKSPHRSVQVQGLNTLNIFCLSLINNNAIDLISQFLPGITESLLSILTGDYKRGSKVFTVAGNIWTSILIAIFNDKENFINDNDSQNTIENILFNVTKEQSEHEKWISLAVSRLETAFYKIFSTLSCMDQQLHWKRVDVLSKLAGNILVDCGLVFYYNSKNTKGSGTKYLMSCLLLTLQHSHNDIQNHSQNALEIFSTKNPEVYRSILLENIKDLLTKHTNTIRREHDAKNYSTMVHLRNLIILLGEDVEELLWSSIDDLSQCLCEICTLNTADVNYNYPKKTFRYFRDERIYDVICDICRFIGHLNCSLKVFDYFISILNSPKHPYRIQSAIILNQLSLGHCYINLPKTFMNLEIEILDGLAMDDRKSYIELLLEEYLSQDSFKPDELTNINQEIVLGPASGYSILSNEPQQKLLFTCFLLEGIGNFAICIGESFSYQLMQVLLPLFKNLGDSDTLISDYARGSLEKICSVCKYNDIAELIRRNSDYLVDKIASQMKYIHLYPDTPKAFRALLLFADYNVLPLIGDMTKDALKALDSLHEEITELLIQIIHQILVVLLKIRINSPKDFLPIQNNNIDEEDKDEKSKNDILPQTMEVTKSIMEKAQHFLASKNRIIKVTCLNIISLATELLYKDFSSSLLPLVHQCWKSIINRLNENDAVIITKALTTIQTLSKYCKDYLRGKILSDLWPIIKKSLKSSYMNFYFPNIQNTMKPEMNDNYKVQKEILSTISIISHSIPNLSTDFINEVARFIVIYLDDSPDNLFKQYSIETFKSLMNQNIDCIWFCLGSLYSLKIEGYSSNELEFDSISFPEFTFDKLWQTEENKINLKHLTNSCRAEAKYLLDYIDNNF